ncbi:phage tail assembly chaperone G [Virgibacillus salexigens]|uniref:phage tail assembly chaperone G n=1 Tax=Virgibacillus TaxID=84406 RepID=UPI00136A90AA|nr:hypothetical protein [Virgibacillus massiliensis]MYL41826.1 hypothetical protein [Virgibacillus massiliensis]
MQIELIIDGEKKIFTAPFIPMLARRKYFEIQAKAEEREEREEKPTTKEILSEDDEIMSILTNVVFKDQFTINQLLEGASKTYVDGKLAEAVFGIAPKAKKEGNEGNEQGK